MPSTPSEAIGQIEPRKPPPADVHPAVEEDHDQRDHAEALDGEDRQRRPQAREQLGGDRRAEEEERGPGIGKRSVALFARSAR